MLTFLFDLHGNAFVVVYPIEGVLLCHLTLVECTSGENNHNSLQLTALSQKDQDLLFGGKGVIQSRFSHLKVSLEIYFRNLRISAVGQICK